MPNISTSFYIYIYRESSSNTTKLQHKFQKQFHSIFIQVSCYPNWNTLAIGVTIARASIRSAIKFNFRVCFAAYVLQHTPCEFIKTENEKSCSLFEICVVHLWVRSSQDFDTNNFDARAGFAYDWFTCVGLPMDWDTNPSPGTQSFRFSFLPFFLHLFWHVGASNLSNNFDRWIKSEIVSAN